MICSTSSFRSRASQIQAPLRRFRLELMPATSVFQSFASVSGSSVATPSCRIPFHPFHSLRRLCSKVDDEVLHRTFAFVLKPSLADVIEHVSVMFKDCERGKSVVHQASEFQNPRDNRGELQHLFTNTNNNVRNSRPLSPIAAVINGMRSLLHTPLSNGLTGINGIMASMCGSSP